MQSPGAVQALVLVLTLVAAASTQSVASPTASSAGGGGGAPTVPSTAASGVTQPTLSVPCCFASAQNATSLGPVVVLRRDDEQPSGSPTGASGAGGDPTWEATLRRAATRALTWEGLADAPFVASHHSPEVLAALDEPGDIRVLARGLLVADRDARPVFREVDLPGEQCVDCPADLPGPNGESIKAMWSVRRIRHSGPNADHRPCYELQFSVTPIVPSLPPLNRWLPPGAGPAAAGPEAATGGLRAALRAESRVSRQRELRPKGLILRVNPVPDTLPLQQLAANALSMADAIQRAPQPGAPLGPSVGASPGDTLALQQLAAHALGGALGGGVRAKPLGAPLSPGNTLPLQQLAANALSTQAAASRAATSLGTSPATTPRVHEHLHHHFYVRGGVPMYAGSTTETEIPVGSSAPSAASPTAPLPFRPSPQYHEYSQPDPLFHPPPGLGGHVGHSGHVGHAGHKFAGHSGHVVLPDHTGPSVEHAEHVEPSAKPVHAPGPAHYPNSINEQLPPARDGADTRVPYVSATKQTAVTPEGTAAPTAARPTTPRPGTRPTTLRFPVEDADGSLTVTILPATPTSAGAQLYRITGGYSFTTPNSVEVTRPGPSKAPYKTTSSKATKRPFKSKTKVPPTNYYEIGRPTKVYPAADHDGPTDPADFDDAGPTLSQPTASATTPRPSTVTTSEFLSEYPAATVRGTTPTRPTTSARPTTSVRPTASVRPPTTSVRTTAAARPTMSSSVTMANRVPLFTPHYGTQGKGKDFEMSILKVMSSKVPSYIDVFEDNGVRATTDRPTEHDEDAADAAEEAAAAAAAEEDGGTMHSHTSKISGKYGKHTKALVTSTRLFKENPRTGPYSLVSNSSSELESLRQRTQSSTQRTRQPPPPPPAPADTSQAGSSSTSTSSTSTSTGTPAQTTPSAPLQITFFVASEDDTRQPSASTLVSEPYKQDDTTTYQYTILRAVEQSIDVMKHENDTQHQEPRSSTEPMSSTRRSFTEANILRESSNTNAVTLPSPPDVLSVVNGHTNHINPRAKHVTDSYSQLLKSTETPTTRKPWRPSTRARRPWRQRSSYKEYYQNKREQNHTTTASSVDPTSIVESRKTYSVSASRRRKPSYNQQGKVFVKNQKLNRREPSEYQNGDENLQTSPNTDLLRTHRVSSLSRRFPRPKSDHSSLLR